MSDRQVDKELAELTAARIRRARRREDDRWVKNNARENAKGKTKPRRLPPMGRALNHKKPRGNQFIKRGNRFSNPMASLGYTDAEYAEYLRTGKTKAQQQETE